ncbi:MAG TPA: hypothetical protein VG722_02245 [Tepidisphaeraceae bacterium]|nr:hypothetical protein [Tepidisphaeraceae bacterium]
MKIVRLCGILGLALALAGCWGNTPKWQTYMTAAAIEAGISNDFNNEINEIGDVGGNWKILNDKEYDQLILRISARREMPGPPGWKRGMLLTDAWGKRFHVAVKNDDVVVWSNGPDGIENTPDDIISPHTFKGKLPTTSGKPPTTHPTTHPTHAPK